MIFSYCNAVFSIMNKVFIEIKKKNVLRFNDLLETVFFSNCNAVFSIINKVFIEKKHTGIPELWTQLLDAGRWTLHLGRWALGTGYYR